ncbi:MAG: hypothetical protein LT070_12230 [Solirubrobacteraceae bacterium]|nr:hypothetical protein [Solirubrobacteraceae bacterium]
MRPCFTALVFAGALIAIAVLGSSPSAPASIAGRTAAPQRPTTATATATVSIEFNAFSPAHVDVLAGDTVRWRNESVRTHTVTAVDRAFDSGPISGGEGFARRLETDGAVAYYCRLHPSMRGEIDAHTLLLDEPAGPGASGHAFPLRGRAALPTGTEVSIEGDDGGGYAPVARALVADDGSFSASVTPTTTTRYRAVSTGRASPEVRLVVVDHAVLASAERHGRRVVVRARVKPAAPGATVVLQLRLRDRFGWWPVRRGRLDGASRARFALSTHRAVRARVRLTLPDGATALATSSVVRLGPFPRRHGG